MKWIRPTSSKTDSRLQPATCHHYLPLMMQGFTYTHAEPRPWALEYPPPPGQWVGLSCILAGSHLLLENVELQAQHFLHVPLGIRQVRGTWMQLHKDLLLNVAHLHTQHQDGLQAKARGFGERAENNLFGVICRTQLQANTTAGA